MRWKMIKVHGENDDVYAYVYSPCISLHNIGKEYIIVYKDLVKTSMHMITPTILYRDNINLYDETILNDDYVETSY